MCVLWVAFGFWAIMGLVYGPQQNKNALQLELSSVSCILFMSCSRSLVRDDFYTCMLCFVITREFLVHFMLKKRSSEYKNAS